MTIHPIGTIGLGTLVLSLLTFSVLANDKLDERALHPDFDQLPIIDQSDQVLVRANPSAIGESLEAWIEARLAMHEPTPGQADTGHAMPYPDLESLELPAQVFPANLR